MRLCCVPQLSCVAMLGVSPCVSCSINQLDTLVRQPSLRLLVNSATFLKTQLPARLENHIHRLKVG